MKILITGTAGFIGSALAYRLLERGDTIIGVDNHNDYYDPMLKENRLKNLLNHRNYTHLRIDISDRTAIKECFDKYRPIRVVNLAAQAGVRFSIENPIPYIDSNIIGFSNILECCRKYAIDHLVYASSSSVYGSNTKMPFSIHHNVDHPLSLYAATKKSNELMAHAYSHLYNLPTTGLRFFTVYGPWGRPDMALFKFTKLIIEGKPIQVYNYGKHRRDFTYIDDIIEGVIRIIDRPAFQNESWNSLEPDPGSSIAPWRIYNIGNNKPVSILNYIKALESSLNRKAKIEFLPMQLGDVPDTYADIDDLIDQFNFKPKINVTEGINKFVTWYIDYFQIKK
jgi:UDP-glucuronate 4-epimerase